jgi:hypothetical protein
MLATAKACPRRFLFEYILNRVPATPSFHLTAGSAYARGHQVFRELYYGEGAPKEDALTAGLVALTKTYGPDDPPDPTNPKTYRRTAAALVGYYHEWPPETDFIRPHTINSQPCVEFSFAIPFDGTGGRPLLTHPTTGEPLIYAGRADSIMTFGNGLFIFDDKTTSTMGPKWALNWRLRSQFTGYCWAAREHGYPVEGAIIRGVSIQKTQIKYQQAITYRPAWLIDSWLDSTAETVLRIIHYWRAGVWPADYDSACTSYGSCAYLDACSTPEPLSYLSSTIFTDRTWSPIALEAE